MITIGKWIFTATNPDDIVAKFYFARKQLIWEFLPDEPPRRLKRKMVIQWNDVLSFQERFASCDGHGILEIELSKRPNFYIETNPRPGKHTQWKVEEDFTGNQASTYRIHTLHFHPGVLQENLEKLLSCSFWSKLHEVRFPTQEAIHFDYGSNYNNSSLDFPSQSPLLNVNNDQHHHSQGISPLGVEEGNFDMTRHISADYGLQNSYTRPNSWNHTVDELLRMTSAISPLAQVGVEEGNFGMTTHISADYGLQNSNTQPNSWTNTANGLFGTTPAISLDDDFEWTNTEEELFGMTRAIPPLAQVTNEPYNTPYMDINPMYPQVGHVARKLLEEDVRQHMEQTIRIR